MTQSLTMELPWPEAALSPNGRVHHFTRARAVKKAKTYAQAMTLSLMGPLGIKRGSWVGPITVEWTFHPAMTRIRDDDGLIGRCKSARDGIALALGVDDHGFRTMPIVYGENRRPACVMVTLTPAAIQIPVKGRIG